MSLMLYVRYSTLIHLSQKILVNCRFAIEFLERIQFVLQLLNSVQLVLSLLIVVLLSPTWNGKVPSFVLMESENPNKQSSNNEQNHQLDCLVVPVFDFDVIGCFTSPLSCFLYVLSKHLIWNKYRTILVKSIKLFDPHKLL